MVIYYRRVSYNNSPPSTTSALENINCKRMNLKLADPQRSIVASFGNGRLGNQMANFASCYAVMKDYELYHYLMPTQLKILQKVFLLPELKGGNNSSYYVWDKGKYISYADKNHHGIGILCENIYVEISFISQINISHNI